MPPLPKSPANGEISENVVREFPGEESANTDFENEDSKASEPYRYKIVWPKVMQFSYLHLAAIYGIYLIFTSAKIATTVFALLLGEVAFFGITAGAHRLWSHRAYKAKLPLRILLMLMNTICHQDDVYAWSRDHRVHHKFTETTADPYNARNGLFFSHVGWLLVRKHPQVIAKGKTIDMSDLEKDAVVMFQRRYFNILMPLMCFILPTAIPMYFWGETFSNAWHVAGAFRYVWILNATFLVNSVAHAWGNKPYDKNMYAVQNLAVSVSALGEGWHNYHHCFPWDYKTSELGQYSTNFSTAFIDFFSKLGWAYDLKTVGQDMIKSRVERSGDGSHPIWGWGDKSMPKSDKERVKIINGKRN